MKKRLMTICVKNCGYLNHFDCEGEFVSCSNWKDDDVEYDGADLGYGSFKEFTRVEFLSRPPPIWCNHKLEHLCGVQDLNEIDDFEKEGEETIKSGNLDDKF